MSDKESAMRRKQQEVYATLGISMDHLLCKLQETSAAPLPASLRLRHEERALPDAWARLQECVAKRRSIMQKKKKKEKHSSENNSNSHSKEEKKSKSKSKSKSVVAAEATVSEDKAALKKAKDQPPQSSMIRVRTMKIDAARANAEPLGSNRKNGKIKSPRSTGTAAASNNSSSKKLSPRSPETGSSSLSPRYAPGAVKATGGGGSSSPRFNTNAAAVKKEKPRAPTPSSGFGFVKQQVAPQALTKLRELPCLENLEMETPKYNAIIKWLNCDQGKNGSISDELSELLKDIDRKQLFVNKGVAKPSPVTKVNAYETLDDRLRKEKKEKFAEKRRSNLKRKRETKYGADYDDDYEPVDALKKEKYEDEEDDEEEEYADGYSDSDEAELAIELDDPVSPKGKTRDITGGTKRYATSAKTSPGSEPSAKEQLAKVVARIKEEEDKADVKDATYLSYSKTATNTTATATSSTAVANTAGTSAQSAIILEDSEEEEEEEEEEEVVQPVKKPAAKPAPRPAPKAAKRKEESDDDEEEDAEDSSTDDDQDLFDLNEEDVYIVESILEVKIGRTLSSKTGRGTTKEMDLYLVKWDGYDELTWEPEANIPKRLIEMFRNRELTKQRNRYKIQTFTQRKIVKNLTTGRDDTIYLIHWVGEQVPIWECRSNLPEQVVIWLEKTSRATSMAAKKKARA